jgi:uncharacterized membrane protein
MTRPEAQGIDVDQRFVAALAYALGAISGAIVLAFERRHRFVRFHAAQSVIFSLGVMLFSLLASGLPLLSRPVGQVLGLAAIVVWIYLMVQAFRGRWFKLPFVGQAIDDQLR